MTDIEMTAEERERLEAAWRAYDAARHLRAGNMGTPWHRTVEAATSAPYERALAEVTAERDRLRAQLEWTKAAIERNGNPRERDDMTMHRLNGVLAEVYAGVAGALATTEQQEEQG